MTKKEGTQLGFKQFHKKSGNSVVVNRSNKRDIIFVDFKDLYMF